jgi:hypothetical protein
VAGNIFTSDGSDDVHEDFEHHKPTNLAPKRLPRRVRNTAWESRCNIRPTLQAGRETRNATGLVDASGEGPSMEGRIGLARKKRLYIPLWHASTRSYQSQTSELLLPVTGRGSRAADLVGSGWGRSGPSAPGTAGPPRPPPPRAPQCPPRAPPTPRGCPGHRSRASTPPPPKTHEGRQATAGGRDGGIAGHTRAAHELKMLAGPRRGIGLLQ